MCAPATRCFVDMLHTRTRELAHPHCPWHDISCICRCLHSCAWHAAGARSAGNVPDSPETPRSTAPQVRAVGHHQHAVRCTCYTCEVLARCCSCAMLAAACCRALTLEQLRIDPGAGLLSATWCRYAWPADLRLSWMRLPACCGAAQRHARVWRTRTIVLCKLPCEPALQMQQNQLAGFKIT